MVDTIATVKRVQQRKQLGNALTSNAKQKAVATAAAVATASGSNVVPRAMMAGKVKPPPLLAKRSARDDSVMGVNGAMEVDEARTLVGSRSSPSIPISSSKPSQSSDNSPSS
ncbi:hypothetical protein IW140_003066 [Coemansia sp. RSA 1813]|nr:hypothetical protein EV178_004223 [Coemansia sp. RSA 1646]KAJ1771293.1 hypothetical protein LPJ74_002444 [Coemansia sp. RSA 1843]KAJ2088947.1 hypothetical protein IW138_003788 [Coemansia sp. RSA 986]KAJ2213246.1 hypothetical protein EV179_004033 [Coemansia sp. RSA 487]KAJ2569512.1 hypothetical protein IW140_003066 [Coemansia sp. RSA 1813]